MELKKIILLASFLIFIFSCSEVIENQIPDQSIVFTWDHDPYDDTLGSVTETIGGLMVTVTAPLSIHKHSMGYMDIIDTDGNSKDNVVVSYHAESTITFVFNKPLRVISIMALSGDNEPIEYTFTPLDGNNTFVKQTLTKGKNVAHAHVILNWDLVSSFTVTSSMTLFGFDNLEVVEHSMP